MTKLISIKDLQKNIKSVREEVEKGVHFVVLYRSKPVFEINALDEEWTSRERYMLMGGQFEFWNTDKDDELFDESIEL